MHVNAGGAQKNKDMRAEIPGAEKQGAADGGVTQTVPAEEEGRGEPGAGHTL